eukprot:2864095-Rhodomonas_salina.4
MSRSRGVSLREKPPMMLPQESETEAQSLFTGRLDGPGVTVHIMIHSCHSPSLWVAQIWYH